MKQQPPLPTDLPPDMPPIPGAAHQWFVQLPQGIQGPLAPQAVAELASGGSISQSTFAWRQGMIQWAPICSIPEFSRMIFPATSATRRQTSEDASKRTARNNLISIFVVFLLGFIPLIIYLFQAPRDSLNWYRLMCFAAFVISAAAIFAAIYIPARWRVIMKLSTTTLIIGLIGGIGLVLMTLIWLVPMILGWFK